MNNTREHDPLLREANTAPTKVTLVLSIVALIVALVTIVLTSVVLHRVYEEEPNLDFLSEPVDCITFSPLVYDNSTSSLYNAVYTFWVENKCGFEVDATLAFLTWPISSLINVTNVLEPRLLNVNFTSKPSTVPVGTIVQQSRSQAINQQSKDGTKCVLQSTYSDFVYLSNNCLSTVNVTYYLKSSSKVFPLQSTVLNPRDIVQIGTTFQSMGYSFVVMTAITL